MRKMQFDPKNGMPRYHGTAAAEKKKQFLWDAAVKDGILAIDFYRKGQDKWSAVCRILMNDKEFENYDYEKKEWNKKHIENLMGEKQHAGFGYIAEKEKVITDGSRKVIEEYIRQNGGYIYKRITETISAKERNLIKEARETAEERKYNRIQKKMASLPEPPRDFKKVILETAFKNDHILYFGKERAYCTRCGREVTVQGKTHNETGKCPKCRKGVVFKNTRYIKEHAEDREVLYIQKQRNEIVLRYFKCALLSTEHSREMLEMTESVRTYHGKTLADYKKRYIHYYDYNGQDFWTDKMNCYHQVAYGRKTCLYTGNMEEVRESVTKETCDVLEQLGREGKAAPVIDLIKGYGTKIILLYEKLYKAGMHRLALEVLKGRWGFNIDEGQRELKKVLRISKPMMKHMAAHDGNRKMLEAMQDAFRDRHGLNDEKIFEIAGAGIKVSELARMAEKEKIVKLFHYLKKAKGYKSLRKTLEHYRDYMGMVTEMGYDMSRESVRYPHDLRQAHDRAVEAFNEAEADERKRKALMKYPGIRNRQQELDERYSFRTKEYVVIAPASAADIIEEGRILHHCVGGDGYLEKHEKGSSFILFMRNADKPEEPYYTMEIDPVDNRIMQYYGANDRKPDKEKVDKFLKLWKGHLAKKARQEKDGEAAKRAAV